MSHLPNVYAIISSSDIDNVDFSQVFEENTPSLRYSIDELMFIIKWFNEHEPSFITNGSVVPTQVLTHEQAIELMATIEWTEPIPVE